MDEFRDRAVGFRLLKASPFWNVLFLMTIVTLLFKKHVMLALTAVLLLFIPREHWVMTVPASLVLGAGSVYMIDLLARLAKRKPNLWRVALAWSLALVALVDSAFTQLSTIDAREYDISRAQVGDLLRIRAEGLVPEDAPVLVIGNNGLVEWSPALLQREVLTNSFGLEWIPGRYKEIETLAVELQSAADLDAVIALMRESYSGLKSVYIIAETGYWQKLASTSPSPALLEWIGELDNLTVARLDLK